MSDIFFERTDGSESDRAYTLVAHSGACVGNRWIQREWSRFPGYTTSLIQKSSGMEWAAPQSPEFILMIDDAALRAPELPEVDYTEEINPAGATLIATYSRPGLILTIRNFALHDNPALVRTVTLRNTGDKPIHVQSIWSDALTMDSENVLVSTNAFSKKEVSVLWDTEETCAALLGDNGGLLYGRIGASVFDLGDSKSHTHGVVHCIDKELKPSETFTCDTSFIIPFDTDPKTAAATLVPDMVRRIDDQEKRDAANAKEIKKEENSRNSFPLTITSLVNGGDGLGRVDGQVCFVPYGLPGDTLAVSTVTESKSVLHGKIESVTEPSEHRCPPDCPVFGKCGGCTWLHFAYPGQGEWKRNIVKESFKRTGKLDVEVGWADDPKCRLGYRTRATFQYKEGAWGFFEAGSHRVVDIPSCPLLHPRLNEAFSKLRESGTTQPVEITVNPEVDEVLVWTEKADSKLAAIFPMYNAAGSGTKRHRFLFDGVPIVNGLFSQSSLLLNRVLRREVERHIGEPASLLDLYAGSGNLSLGYAEFSRVVGIDHSGPAIMAAHALERGEYHVGDESRFVELIEQEPWDVIVLDPPRTGAKRLIKALGKAKAKRIVYVSCDPATLARDAGQLAKVGWKLKEAVAVDLFPQTVHIETVCLFERS